MVCNLLIILCICRGDRSNSSANSSIVKPSIKRRCRIFLFVNYCLYFSVLILDHIVTSIFLYFPCSVTTCGMLDAGSSIFCIA